MLRNYAPGINNRYDEFIMSLMPHTEKTPRQLVHEARDAIKKAAIIEEMAKTDPRLFGFASISRSVARDSLIDASILLDKIKPKSSHALIVEARRQGGRALEDYQNHQGHYASAEEVDALSNMLRRENLL